MPRLKYRIHVDDWFRLLRGVYISECPGRKGFLFRCREPIVWINSEESVALNSVALVVVPEPSEEVQDPASNGTSFILTKRMSVVLFAELRIFGFRKCKGK